MPLTRDFKETIQARVDSDPEFRVALLREAVACILDGDLDTGKSVLRDYINATIGFPALADELDKEKNSLMRMLAPSGNPTMANLSAILQHLKDAEGVEFELRVA